MRKYHKRYVCTYVGTNKALDRCIQSEASVNGLCWVDGTIGYQSSPQQLAGNDYTIYYDRHTGDGKGKVLSFGGQNEYEDRVHRVTIPEFLELLGEGSPIVIRLNQNYRAVVNGNDVKVDTGVDTPVNITLSHQQIMILAAEIGKVKAQIK